MLGKIEGKRRRQRIKWLHNLTDLMDMSLSNLWEIEDREAWRAAVHSIAKSQVKLTTSKTFFTGKQPYSFIRYLWPCVELISIYIDLMGLRWWLSGKEFA